MQLRPRSESLVLKSMRLAAPLMRVVRQLLWEWINANDESNKDIIGFYDFPAFRITLSPRRLQVNRHQLISAAILKHHYLGRS
jgi:hypothetical protein